MTIYQLSSNKTNLHVIHFITAEIGSCNHGLAPQPLDLCPIENLWFHLGITIRKQIQRWMKINRGFATGMEYLNLQYFNKLVRSQNEQKLQLRRNRKY